MFKEVQEETDIPETSSEMPDLMIEHGSTRVTVDMTAIEWIILALIVAIVGYDSLIFCPDARVNTLFA